MHFVISYDLSAEGTRRAEIERRIESVLSPYQHVKRLSTFYVVRIERAFDWDDILKKLNSLSTEIPEEFHFIMTNPNTQLGKYNGILYRGEWEDINNLTMK